MAQQILDQEAEVLKLRVQLEVILEGSKYSKALLQEECNSLREQLKEAQAENHVLSVQLSRHEWDDKEVETLKAQLQAERAARAIERAALNLIATPKRADGTYNRSREACEQLARATLTVPSPIVDREKDLKKQNERPDKTVLTNRPNGQRRR